MAGRGNLPLWMCRRVFVKQQQHGGFRPGAGRKPTIHEPQERTTLYLPESLAKALRDIAGGNLSAGVRQLAERAGIWTPNSPAPTPEE